MPSVLASFVGSSTNTSTSWAPTITAGTPVQAGDRAIIIFTSVGGGSPTVSDNSGDGVPWDVVPFSGSGVCFMWTKVLGAQWASGGETVTVSNAVDSCAGVLAIITDDPGDILDITVENNASGNESHAAITPTHPDSLVCAAIFNNIDNLAITSLSWATLGAATHTKSHLSAAGNDSSTHWASGAQVGGPTSTGTLTWSQATNTSTISIMFTVAPLGAGAGTEHPLSGSSAGIADATGNLAVARALSGLAAGQGDATATLRRAITLAGLAEGDSSTQGTLSFLIELAGLAAGSSDATGALRLQHGLLGQAAGSSDAEAALRVLRALSGSAAGEADGVGSLAVLRALAGLADGTSDATALLGVDRTLSGMSHGSSNVVGSLSVVVSLSGLAEGDSTAIADLRRAVALAGLAAGESELTANLTILDEGGPLPFIVLTLERTRTYVDVLPSESLAELAPSRTHAEVLQ